MERLVRVTAPQVKGAHDAEMALVGEHAYVVAEVNDVRPGEGAGWPEVYAALSIVHLRTLAVEAVIPFARSGQAFENETLPAGACFVPRIIAKDERTLRCYFASEQPGRGESQTWFIDFDLATRSFAKRIYRAKLKTAAGVRDMQPRHFHADAAAHGFRKPARDFGLYLFDSFKMFDGRTYVAINNYPGGEEAGRRPRTLGTLASGSHAGAGGGTHMRQLLLALMALVSASSSASAAVTVVDGGKPRAAIVIPDKPLPVEEYAARELAYHVRKATGVELPVAKEAEVPAAPAGRIYLGNTRAAAQAGLSGEQMAPEEFVLRTAGNALFIVGHDSDGPALDSMTWAGTLFGVYQLLEDALQVRWLWPGELGEVVPRCDRLAIADTDRKIAPRLVQRQLRSSLGMRDQAEGGFSPKALAKVRKDESVFLRRHRQGKSLRLRYGHSFTNWWERYGKEHPDWFQMIDGKRPEPGPRGEMSMCVSNPGFHQQIIDNWLEARREDPTRHQSINCCENDVYGRCSCPTCLSWDVERPEKPISDRYEEKCVSDRYARFWLTIQQMAAKHDPKAVVTGYAYVNYALPPLKTKLNEQIVIGIVPDVFFPRTPEEQKWVLDLWAGWRKTGCRMFLRPNYTLEGYCMPYLYMHQFAEEFVFDARNGMVATDYDSLTAMWATQGPQLYLLARWPNELDQPVDAVLAEYYAGFGPAAAQVKAYFDYWEQYTMSHLPQLRDSAKKNGGNWVTFPRMAYDSFPPEALAAGRKRLDAAAAAAAKDPEAAARVAFLEKGLTHAEKCVALSTARVTGRFRDVARAAADLRAYRARIEEENVANLNFCAWQEFRAWGASRELAYNGEPLKPLSDTVAPAQLKPISTRNAHGFVALLKAGERFRADVACLQVGKYTAPCRWSLADAEGTVIADGVIAPGKAEKLEIAVPKAGAYSFVEDPGANGGLVTLLNDHAALLGRVVTLIGETAPLSIFVPKGTRSFTVTLKTSAPGETAKLTVLDPEGKEVASGETGAKPTYTARVEVAEGMDGKAWSLVVSKAATGVLEDVALSLSDDLPGYWSQAADRLLVPAP